MATRHLIVGGGPAAMYALETIREIDRDGSVTLLSDEPPYARMALPYYLCGEIPDAHLMYGDRAYFERMKVETIFGQRVRSVDPKANEVTLDDGTKRAYDDLLIATGASATAPPIPGREHPAVCHLWTLDDTHRALTRARRGADVVLIGAGFIGFIVLNALYKLGCRLAVVEREGQILPRMLDWQGASFVERWLPERGVEVHAGTTVQAIEGLPDGRMKLGLRDGDALTADLVIIATGIRTNLDLVEGSGIETGDGIVIDGRMRTNVSNVFAAGDVAEGPDLFGGRAVHAIQPTAEDHGRIAGANMAGLDVTYEGSLLMNITDVAGLHCASFGLWKGDGHEETVLANPSRCIYRKLVWDEDRVVGAILVGPVDDTSMLNDTGMVKGLIQTQVPLKAWKGYILKNPLDIRRAYVASGAPAALLQRTLLGKPSREKQYRFRGVKPVTRPTDAHSILVGTRPDIKLL
jgi:NADPH-dependent 2,4-dienoyl-CoA reductase/sulfur reductase-like enzyme